MYVKKINAPLLNLPAEHIARLFLESFIECREQCIGLELPQPYGKNVDQEWYSNHDGKKYTYSSFAYKYLAFDIELDGWLLNAPLRTDLESAMLRSIPRLKILASECKEAAIMEHNQEIVFVAEKVLRMLRLWSDCIEFRVEK